MIFTVKDLLEERPKPLTITSDKMVAEAIGLMNEHDFSQLPLVNQEGKPIGIITSDSILRAANHFHVLLKDLRVTEAMEDAKTTRSDGDLFELLDEVQRSYAVLIVDAHDHLIGIVTHFDTTAYFRRRAEDMMFIEDIETRLKEYIAFIYESERDQAVALAAAINEVANSYRKLRRKYEAALKTLFKNPIQSGPGLTAELIENSFKCFGQRDQTKELDDLTFEELTDVLLRHKNCPTTGADGHSSAVRQLLNAVRDTRNTLAHFRRDISAEERDRLRFCSNWLKRAFARIQPDRLEAPSVAGSGSTATGDVLPIEETSEASDSIYAPLAAALLRMDAEEVSLAFEQIEGTIKYPLPASARTHRAWWANDRSHSHARQWLDAGWKVKKVSDGGVLFCRIKEREDAYNAFFTLLIDSLKKNKQISPPDPIPNGRSYFCCAILRGSIKRQLRVYASFARNGRLRIELYLGLGNKFLNKRCWQLLFERRVEIEHTLGQSLSWERLDEKDAARIALYHPSSIGSFSDTSLIPWATDAIGGFIGALREPVKVVLDAIQGDSGIAEV